MRRLPTQLEGLVLVEPVIHGDARGFFLESWRRDTYAALGVGDDFVQDNHSRSRRGIVRGMHFQPGMGKLVRCARGAILDVAVDLRRDGGQFGRWDAAELSEANGHSLFVPDGFAHGFCVLSEEADVVYRCTDYYRPEGEGGFAYDDPDVGIEWPAGLPLQASERDRTAPRLAEIADALPF